MPQSVLRSKRDFLLSTQNADGGWGYFPGKHSRLEPTIYAALALRGTEANKRAVNLVRSWALSTGGWMPSAELPEANWTSALAITLYTIESIEDSAYHAGVVRLVRTIGADGSFWYRLVHQLRPETNDMDISLQGWPWKDGTSCWVEPTVHSLIALRKVRDAGALHNGAISLALDHRISVAEKMLLDRRAEDGGWNYGNRRVWTTPLPSYPETTALALLGLHGNKDIDLSISIAVAERYWQETRSPLARAWLAIALRNFGRPLPLVDQADPKPSQDILLAALQSLGEPNGGHQFFATRVNA